MCNDIDISGKFKNSLIPTCIVALTNTSVSCIGLPGSCVTSWLI